MGIDKTKKAEREDLPPKFKSFISALLNHMNSEQRGQNQIPRLNNITANEVMNIFLF